jgi:hypothetical protein
MMCWQHLTTFWCCLQEAAGKVLLEQLEGPPRPPGRISTPLQLAGLDVTANALLLHDGRQAHVYRISESDNSLTQLSQFDSPGVPVAADVKQAAEEGATGGSSGVTVAGGSSGGCSMALYNDSVYRTAERKVEVCNLSGESNAFLHCITIVRSSFFVPCRLCVHLGWLIPSEMVTGPTCDYSLLEFGELHMGLHV